MGPGTIAALEALLGRIAMLPGALFCSATDANGPGDRFAERHRSLRKCSAYRLHNFGLHSKAATGTTSSMRARNRKHRRRERVDARRHEHQSCSTEPRAFVLPITGCRFDLRDSDLTCRDRRRSSPRLPPRPCAWPPHPDGNVRFLSPGTAWPCRRSTTDRSGKAGGSRMLRDENGAKRRSTRRSLPSRNTGVISQCKAIIAFDKRFIANHGIIA